MTTRSSGSPSSLPSIQPPQSVREQDVSAPVKGRPAGSRNRRTARRRRGTCYVLTSSSLEAKLDTTVMGVSVRITTAKRQALDDARAQHDPEVDGELPSALTWTPHITDATHEYHASHGGVNYVLTRVRMRP